MTAFSESIIAPYRRSRRDGQRREAALAALGYLVEVTQDTPGRAAQLRATRPIKLLDALILATAMRRWRPTRY
jgi:hypothetical protein